VSRRSAWTAKRGLERLAPCPNRTHPRGWRRPWSRWSPATEGRSGVAGRRTWDGAAPAAAQQARPGARGKGLVNKHAPPGAGRACPAPSWRGGPPPARLAPRSTSPAPQARGRPNRHGHAGPPAGSPPARSPPAGPPCPRHRRADPHAPLRPRGTTTVTGRDLVCRGGQGRTSPACRPDGSAGLRPDPSWSCGVSLPPRHQRDRSPEAPCPARCRPAPLGWAGLPGEDRPRAGAARSPPPACHSRFRGIVSPGCGSRGLRRDVQGRERG